MSSADLIPLKQLDDRLRLYCDVVEGSWLQVFEELRVREVAEVFLDSGRSWSSLWRPVLSSRGFARRPFQFLFRLKELLLQPLDLSRRKLGLSPASNPNWLTPGASLFGSENQSGILTRSLRISCREQEMFDSNH